MDNEPLSESEFTTSFFEVWDRLDTKPVYFRFLTLMALHTFLKSKVDAAVIECGIGGEYDSTNILVSPIVTGITSLGIDHTAMLGSTISEIAWHKAGIMKTGTPAFTSPQPSEAMSVLQRRAAEKQVDLKVVDRHPEIDSGQVKLGLEADFQKTNASLAVEIAASYLNARGQTINTDPLPAEFRRGLETVRWGGRCETRHEKDLSWHVDGGHTLESIRVAAKWFSDCIDGTTAPRILLFNQQTRAGIPLLEELFKTIATSINTRPFTHAIFCSNQTFVDQGFSPDLISVNANQKEVDNLDVQHELATGWKQIASEETNIFVMRTIEEAVYKCRSIASEYTSAGDEKTKVLITGSIHLVGGALEVLSNSR